MNNNPTFNLQIDQNLENPSIQEVATKAQTGFSKIVEGISNLLNFKIEPFDLDISEDDLTTELDW
jgi:hypothetical protein